MTESSLQILNMLKVGNQSCMWNAIVETVSRDHQALFTMHLKFGKEPFVLCVLQHYFHHESTDTFILFITLATKNAFITDKIN